MSFVQQNLIRTSGSIWSKTPFVPAWQETGRNGRFRVKYNPCDWTKVCGGHRPPLHEMKTLYLDIFSGISGDMFIGALLDLGVDAHQFEHELEKLRLEGYHLHVTRGQKSGIAGVKFDV